MKKIYSRINFLNRPSKKTPLNAANLNKMDEAIDGLDNRVVETNDALLVERARIDNLTKLPEGSTTGDAELIDGRVDYKGNTHTNIGEHIREVSSQLSGENAELKEDLDCLEDSVNFPLIRTTDELFDKNMSTNGYYNSKNEFNESGYSSNTIAVSENDVFELTLNSYHNIQLFKDGVLAKVDFFNIVNNPNQAILYYRIPYDVNELKISYAFSDVNPDNKLGCKKVINTNIYSIMFRDVLRKDEFDRILSIISNKVEDNKSICCIGDSITYGYGVSVSYPVVLGNILKCEIGSVHNLGVSGCCLSNNKVFTSEDTSIYNRVISGLIPSNADIIVLMGGTNDKTGDINIGTINSENPQEFYGALNAISDYLLNNYPNAKIIYCTPLQMSNGQNANNVGYKLRDYADAIVNIGEKFSIPVLDLNANGGLCCLSITSLNTNTQDGTHPTQSFVYKLAKKIAMFILSN